MNKSLVILRRLQPYTLHLAALGVAVLLGIGASLVTISTHPPGVDTADRWALPHWAPYKAGPKRDDISGLALWAEDPTKQKVVAAPKAEGPPWRFIGTILDGKKRLAVIELDQGKRVQRIQAGEALPNGAPITSVEAGELTYTYDDTQKTLKLFSVEKIPVVGKGK